MAAVDELLIPPVRRAEFTGGSILQAINYRAPDIMAVTIGIIQINVTDLDRAKRFYGDILDHEITGGTCTPDPFKYQNGRGSGRA